MTGVHARGLLFDLDGVLVDSSAAIRRAWWEWAGAKGLDPATTFAAGHGRQTMDHIRAVAPHLAVPAEERRIDELEARYADAVEPQPGAGPLVASLAEVPWGVVTSCSAQAARTRLERAGIGVPPVLVHAGDVGRGKPHPDGYLRGAELIGVDPAEVVVFEDAPSGIEAAVAAGMRVAGVCTTHDPHQLAGAAWLVEDLSTVRVTRSVDSATLLVHLRECDAARR
ncbi:HAD-IA family hydrolase [Actinoplanes teichomyceticus]|uniref:Sugar-phosphatase n=1 Tax=Actinoplanes teichomyceticus TaxID=1867 RepID=A0A561WKS8_ACTTI|nr:HAD-IA family hydrolase [Actinoplanes teichomyceticus]TWG24443.1 sugar-phosphatase [Actinoplanes teichomyceticus]GIF12706.1 sugar phosphatase [Actinoplanes teichomyceticus]